jgi:hypothetical protein
LKLGMAVVRLECLWMVAGRCAGRRMWGKHATT